MRYLLFLSIVLGTSFMSGGQLWAGPPITVDSPLPWIRVISASDPTFSALAASVVGTSVLQQIHEPAQYAILVTNLGTEIVSGVVVRFSLLIPGGRVIHRTLFYYSFGQPKPLLPSGKTILITPVKTANALAGGALASVFNSGLGSSQVHSMAGELSALRTLASAEQLHASVDLVIAQDGRSAGPDNAKTTTQISMEVRAYDDMRKEILDRIQKGASDEDILRWLQPLAQARALRDAQTGLTDRYVTEQRNLARQWSYYLSHDRRMEVQRILSTPRIYAVPSLQLGGLK